MAGIIGNVMQSFDGKELYESAEEKSDSKDKDKVIGLILNLIERK